MKVYPADQTTLIVHPGTGTILNADECVIYNTDDTAIWLEEDEIVRAAEANNDTLKNLHVVVHGNVFDGIHIIGPFLSWDDAAQWAELNADREWWVTGIHSADDSLAYQTVGV
jgi:hypothetical protein